MPPTILRVALPIPLPQCFDYLPPSGIPLPDSTLGCRVRVPFGKRELIGVVVELPSAEMSVPLREAFAWIDRIPILDGELAQSLQWLSHYTHTPLGEILATALPGLLRHGKPLTRDLDLLGLASNRNRAHCRSQAASQQPLSTNG